MIGPIIVFVVVMVIVAVYMAIIHKFLKASERDGQTAQLDTDAVENHSRAEAKIAVEGRLHRPPGRLRHVY
jgi:hypothetical protein